MERTRSYTPCIPTTKCPHTRTPTAEEERQEKNNRALQIHTLIHTLGPRRGYRPDRGGPLRGNHHGRLPSGGPPPARRGKRDKLKAAVDAATVAATIHLKTLPLALNDTEVRQEITPTIERYVMLNLREPVNRAPGRGSDRRLNSPLPDIPR